MSDWFETRFREPVESGEVDPAFAARVQALVVEEWKGDAASTASHDPDADHHEGDVIMLETDAQPDAGAPPDAPRHRRVNRWLLTAAAIVLVVAVIGALLAARDKDRELDTISPPPAPPPTDVMSLSAAGDTALEPGSYYIDPDGDPSTPLTVTFTVAHEGWHPSFGASGGSANGPAGVIITTVTNLATDGCTDDSPAAPPVGPTVDALATALTRLSPFQVTAAPSDVTIDGFHGKHLTWQAPASSGGDPNAPVFVGCLDGRLYSWISPLNGDGPSDTDGGVFSGYDGGEIEDFWILDVAGTRLVLDTIRSSTTSAQDLAEMEAIFSSIQIHP